jgi:2-polyprenyl-3-methyl-5-hydroxy-6-metoxy-1,4-benzoquinol methylase
MASVTLSKRVEAFYATGRQAVYRIDKWLERNRLSLPTNGTCVEYGCGVGRCTVWLARRFAHVLALDISEPHLRLAQERAKSEGLKNIEFVNIKEKDDLAHINNADFFYSTMVLQHNPPPIIASILRAAFSGLNPGGVAFFQVPTHSIGYFFNIEDYTRNTVDRGMEMHFFPQAALFALASDHGMRPLEVSADNLIGNFGRWTSSSFLLKKL